MYRNLTFLACLVCMACMASGCSPGMASMGRIQPYESSRFFPNEQSARPIPADTVSTDQSADPAFLTGMADGEPVTTLPVAVTGQLLARGQHEFTTFCTPCHGMSAAGDGPVAGYFDPRPASLVSARARDFADGHIYDVISNGYKQMYSYDARIAPADRWAIVAYLRALQRNPSDPLAGAPAAQQQGQ